MQEATLEEIIMKVAVAAAVQLHQLQLVEMERMPLQQVVQEELEQEMVDVAQMVMVHLMQKRAMYPEEEVVAEAKVQVPLSLALTDVSLSLGHALKFLLFPEPVL
jgi:hypothetical protein